MDVVDEAAEVPLGTAAVLGGRVGGIEASDKSYDGWPL